MSYCIVWITNTGIRDVSTVAPHHNAMDHYLGNDLNVIHIPLVHCIAHFGVVIKIKMFTFKLWYLWPYMLRWVRLASAHEPPWKSYVTIKLVFINEIGWLINIYGSVRLATRRAVHL